MSTEFVLFLHFILSTIIASVALVHCLLKTKYPQAALGWSAAIILLPYIGSFSYFLFGVNRVDSRANKLMFKVANHRANQIKRIRDIVEVAECHQAFDGVDHRIVQIGERKTPIPKQGGNSVIPLYNGDDAYPEMLRAIEEAEYEIFLCTFIFKGEKYGQRFVDALVAAHQRGVDVRIIVDGLGTIRTYNNLLQAFIKHGVPLERFIPLRVFPPKIAINLRNHRKLLVCDKIAFTGGMNISDDNVLADHTAHPIQDLHFKCLGPIVFALREAFLLDWIFLQGGTECDDENFTPYPNCHGTMDARLVMDGPGSNDEPIQNLICGVIGAAKQSITIFTPYFLPTREISISLASAAARGVLVRVVVPEIGNHSFVSSAAEHLLPPIVRAGVEVYRQPPPFSHTKLILIDDMYTLLGSTNLDPRSLILNFELNLEVFSYELNSELTTYTDNIIAKSARVEPCEFDFDYSNWRELIKRLKNAAAWVISPYL